MNAHQIQALLTGAITLFLGWQVIRTLLTGEVTVSLNGRGVKRSEDRRNYWSWTLILCALFVIVLLTFLRTLLKG